MFLKLTPDNDNIGAGEAVYLKLSAISGVRARGPCASVLVGGVWIEVNESADSILAALNQPRVEKLAKLGERAEAWGGVV